MTILRKLPALLRTEPARRRAWRLLGLSVVVALLAPVLANHDPLFLQIEGKTRFPAFSGDPYVELPQANGQWRKVRTQEIDWRTFTQGTVILAPVPYSPGDIDPANANFVSPCAHQVLEIGDRVVELPWRYRHWLGTTRTGGDLLSALIHGTRFALLIGLFAALISALIGITLGLMAGYFGDQRLRVGSTTLLVGALLGWIAWYEGHFLPIHYGQPSRWLWWLLPLAGIACCARYAPNHRTIRIPVDATVRGLMSVFLAVPRLVWIILIAATLPPSVTLVILTIGLTGWAEFSQLTRAETLRLRDAGFSEFARSAGMRDARILFRQLLPNFASLLILVFFYHMAGAILSESALSFLGAGVPHDIVTWGGLLQEGRQAIQAWWLLVFPGLALFLLLHSLQTVGGRKAS